MEKAGSHKENCQTIILTCQIQSKSIGELWSKECLLEESHIGKKWLHSVLVLFSVVVQGSFRMSIRGRSHQLEAGGHFHSLQMDDKSVPDEASSGTSLWLPQLL